MGQPMLLLAKHCAVIFFDHGCLLCWGIQHVGMSKDIFGELVLSVYHVGSRSWIQVVKLGGKTFHHLVNPSRGFLKPHQQPLLSRGLGSLLVFNYTSVIRAIFFLEAEQDRRC